MTTSAQSVLASTVNRRPSSTQSSILGSLRRHPMAGFFLLAFAFTWAWEIPIFALTHQQILGPWIVLAPSAAGLVMAAVTEGRVGVVRLVRRLFIWRVGVAWYLVALFLLPAVWVVSLALMPGGIGAFRLPDPSLLIGFASALGAAFFAALLVEEFGWRGFALSRLQARYGPSVGTLILGALWGLWHLPLRALLPGLVPVGVIPVAFELGAILVAVLVVVATRGRLGYEGPGPAKKITIATAEMDHRPVAAGRSEPMSKRLTGSTGLAVRVASPSCCRDVDRRGLAAPDASPPASPSRCARSRPPVGGAGAAAAFRRR